MTPGPAWTTERQREVPQHERKAARKACSWVRPGIQSPPCHDVPGWIQQVQSHFPTGEPGPRRTASDGDLDSPHCSQPAIANLCSSPSQQPTRRNFWKQHRKHQDSSEMVEKVLKMANGTCLTATDTTHVPAAEPQCRRAPKQPALPSLKAFIISQHHAPLSPGTHRHYLWQSVIYRSNPEMLLKQQLGVTGAASSAMEHNCSRPSGMLPARQRGSPPTCQQ